MTDYRPVIPVPPDAPAPDWDKLRPQEAIGDPVKIWTYHTAEGGVAFYVARWLPKDPDDDKVIRPATWDGSKWRLKGMPAPRPFYRLPDIPMSRTRFPWTQNWLNRSVQGGPEHDRQF